MPHQVVLSWDKAPAGQTVTTYNIKRSTVAGGPFINVGSSTTNSFTDLSGFVEGQKYFYEVTAVNAAGESAVSNVASATVPFLVPDAPTNLVAVAS